MDINGLIIISCICMMFVFGRIFIVPIKWIFKLVFNSILGGIVIWIINLIGATWGFHIGLNIYTSVLVRCFLKEKQRSVLLELKTVLLMALAFWI